eukprot:CAMPEP_0115095166 /NCGR_PEP_ID=MMETSP0227-20121206/28829_1 /TAXON_ID=89957 /ORGANISM="Polarella glacialis, Strain CCMP 1383" /LENGTH=237 /DNA_ID=CAMNT_0002488383 /DNA_START=55 /DNA_END=769 /DNA_ORIENTATION=+
MTSQREVIQLVASECNCFADRFFAANNICFDDLATADVSQGEQRAEWFAVYKKFSEEAELTIQNALMLWGVVQAKAFEEDFVDAAQHSEALDGFLSLTDYGPFIRRMHEQVQQRREQDGKESEDDPRFADLAGTAACRPITPHTDGAAHRRLSQLDLRLAEIELERNALLLERRRLVGRVVEPTTASALKREIELQRYRENVGLDEPRVQLTLSLYAVQARVIADEARGDATCRQIH